VWRVLGLNMILFALAVMALAFNAPWASLPLGILLMGVVGVKIRRAEARLKLKPVKRKKR
jgi:hypothetical protein